MSEEKKYEELVDGLEKRIGNSEFSKSPPAENLKTILKSLWEKEKQGVRFTPKKKNRVKRKKQR